MQEIFSPAKLIIFGVVFLFFFSIPILTIMQMQKIDNEKKMKYDLRQLESWAEVYKLKNGNLKGFNDDIEIKMIKIDLTAISGNPVEINFDNDFQKYCIKAKKSDKTLCVDDTGYLGEDGSVCTQGVGRCNIATNNK
ncbi:MAG: hypothetical protein WCX74_00300 [Candidatus Paceibacterota bacterium]